MSKKDSVSKSKPKAITSRKMFEALSASDRLARHRSLDALSTMRREKLSLSDAAKKSGTTPSTVKKYVGSELKQSESGSYVPKEADRQYRRMTVLSSTGLVEVDVRGSRQASLVGEYMNVVKKFLKTGDTTQLKKFEGMRIGKTPLLTDPEAIEELALRHELEFEDIYEGVNL